MTPDPTLSDHDLLVRIYDAIYEPDTGLKALILKNTSVLWGNTKTTGLVSRVDAIEKARTEEARRIWATAGAIAAIVAMIARELMRRFGI